MGNAKITVEGSAGELALRIDARRCEVSNESEKNVACDVCAREIDGKFGV